MSFLLQVYCILLLTTVIFFIIEMIDSFAVNSFFKILFIKVLTETLKL